MSDTILSGRFLFTPRGQELQVPRRDYEVTSNHALVRVRRASPHLLLTEMPLSAGHRPERGTVACHTTEAHRAQKGVEERSRAAR